MTHRACYTSSYIPTSRQTLAKPNMTLGPLLVFTSILLAHPSIFCQGSSLSLRCALPFCIQPPRLASVVSIRLQVGLDHRHKQSSPEPTPISRLNSQDVANSNIEVPVDVDLRRARPLSSVSSFGNFDGGSVGIVNGSFDVCSPFGSMVGHLRSHSHESSGNGSSRSSIGNLFPNRFEPNDGRAFRRSHRINDLSCCF
jgi:hypothetical protein